MARSAGGGGGGRSSGSGGSRSSNSGSRSSGSGGYRSSPSSSLGNSRGGLNSNSRPSMSNQARTPSSPSQRTYTHPLSSPPSPSTPPPPPRPYVPTDPRPRTTVVHHHHLSGSPGGGMSYSRGYGAAVQPRRRGLSTGSFVAIIAAMLIVAVIAGVAVSSVGASISGVPSSTIKRTALSAGDAQGATLIYEDATGDGDWFPDAYRMKNGASTAYNLTGVKFGVYVTREIYGDADPSDSDMQAFASDLYNEWFPDDAAHLLLIIVDQPQFDGYNFWIEVGYAAQTVFDNEARGVLDAYLYTHWFNEKNTASDVFGKTFADTASNIMSVTPTFTQVVTPWFAGIVIFAIVLCAVNAMIKSSAKHKEAAAAKAQADAELLATPIAGLDLPTPEADPLLQWYSPDKTSIIPPPTGETPAYVAPMNPFDDPYNPVPNNQDGAGGGAALGRLPRTGWFLAAGSGRLPASKT